LLVNELRVYWLVARILVKSAPWRHLSSCCLWVFKLSLESLAFFGQGKDASRDLQRKGMEVRVFCNFEESFFFSKASYLTYISNIHFTNFEFFFHIFKTPPIFALSFNL